MTRKEAEMVSHIVLLNQTEFTVTDLQKVSGLTNSVINKMLKGYQSKGNIYSGLLEKCPALSYCDKTHTIGDEIEKTSQRARAYEWDMEAYRKWAGVGTVWLEDDKFHDHERHSGNERKLAEISATNQSEGMALLAESEDIEEDKKLVAEMREIILDKKLRSPDHTKPVTDIRNSATKEIAPSEPVQKSQSSDPDFLQDAECSAPSCDHSAHSQDSAIKDPPPSDGERAKQKPFDVDPDDFKRLDVPLRGPCDRCGSRYVEYIERLTPGRMARKNEPSRRICKKCFKNAQNRKAKSFRVLPGSLNVAGMRRINVDVGRCSVCNTGKAVWKDPENQISICETCYSNAGGISLKEGSV